ncbi:MAG TPA: TRAP transporter substrate-binding protein [Terriglobales bacterium]|nr:TRAP transporter substrate-binding protein [Terriglobales bacterium]
MKAETICGRSPLSRRRFIFGATATALLLPTRRAAAAKFELRQFHNQPSTSPLHNRLTELWAAVEAETNGAVVVRTFPENDHLPGGDPAALKLLVEGGLDFLTLMGGLIAPLVPAAQVQGIPFAFRDHAEVYAAMDGDLGDYLRQELTAKNIYAVPRGCFENGFRHITCTVKPIHNAEDLLGLKMRTPNSPIFTDLFESLGTTPVAYNVNQLYDCLKSGAADAEENALAVVEAFKLYEIQKYVSLTSHMWSGFNQLANLKLWQQFPSDTQRTIERNIAKFAALQRADNEELNATLKVRLTEQGMSVNEAETSSFRARLGPFYGRWKEIVGKRAWEILESHVGKLA